MANIASGLTKKFLDSVIAMANSMVSISLDRKEAYRVLDRLDEANCPKARFLQNLKHRGYINIQKCDDTKTQTIELTDKAKIHILDSISQKLDWDGKYRFISFDIPERLRLNRDGFRRAIKKLGFKQIQKSLWVSQKNVGYFVETAIRYYGVEKFVIYIVSEKSDIDGLIEKYFKD